MVNLMLTTMQDLRPIPPPLKRKEDILLFFKLYDPVKEELWYLHSFPRIGVACCLLRPFSPPY